MNADEIVLIESILSKAVNLLNRIAAHSRHLKDKIGGPLDGNDDESNRRIIGKRIILSSFHLSKQILTSLRNTPRAEPPVLAFIGVRSLIEEYINAKYIFSHPKHQRDRVWMYKVCNDFKVRSFARKALKSRLDNELLRRRAKAVRLLEYYDKYYGFLSGVAHMLLEPVLLLDLRRKTRNQLVIIRLTIELLHNVKVCIIRGFRFPDDVDLESAVKAFVIEIDAEVKKLPDPRRKLSS